MISHITVNQNTNYWVHTWPMQTSDSFSIERHWTAASARQRIRSHLQYGSMGMQHFCSLETRDWHMHLYWKYPFCSWLDAQILVLTESILDLIEGPKTFRHAAIIDCVSVHCQNNQDLISGICLLITVQTGVKPGFSHPSFAFRILAGLFVKIWLKEVQSLQTN